MKESMVRNLNNSYTICDMLLEHIDDIVRIENLSFSTPWSREAFISEVTKNKCAKYRVVMDIDRVIAYGGMWMVLDEGHITNIAVHPDYRGRGVGSILMEDMIKVAAENNINSLTLEVRPSNMSARALYKKYGFQDMAVRKGYYQDSGEDAIIMWKKGIIEN